MFPFRISIIIFRSISLKSSIVLGSWFISSSLSL
nr:MAG TPA: hypothetical protein [Caudoviricetes sp.]